VKLTIVWLDLLMHKQYRAILRERLTYLSPSHTKLWELSQRISRENKMNPLFLQRRRWRN